MVKQEQELLWRPLEEEGLLTKSLSSDSLLQRRILLFCMVYSVWFPSASLKGEKGVWHCSFVESKGFKSEPAVWQRSAGMMTWRGVSCKANPLLWPVCLQCLTTDYISSPPQSHTLPNVKDLDSEDLSSFVLNIHMQTHFERVGRPWRKWHVKMHRLLRKTSKPRGLLQPKISANKAFYAFPLAFSLLVTVIHRWELKSCMWTECRGLSDNTLVMFIHADQTLNEDPGSRTCTSLLYFYLDELKKKSRFWLQLCSWLELRATPGTGKLQFSWTIYGSSQQINLCCLNTHAYTYKPSLTLEENTNKHADPLKLRGRIPSLQ